MAHDLSADLRHGRRAALRDYSASLMSNAKWRAVFTVLENPDLALRQIVIKFVDVAEAKAMGLPWLHAPRAFVDSLKFGPFPLVGIEWVEIPATATFSRANNVPAELCPQDIGAVRTALDGLGKQLPLEVSDIGLRIVGHVR